MTTVALIALLSRSLEYVERFAAQNDEPKGGDCLSLTHAIRNALHAHALTDSEPAADDLHAAVARHVATIHRLDAAVGALLQTARLHGATDAELAIGYDALRPAPDVTTALAVMPVALHIAAMDARDMLAALIAADDETAGDALIRTGPALVARLTAALDASPLTTREQVLEDTLRTTAGALDECLEQISQMRGMFSDEDGTISAAAKDGDSASEAARKVLKACPPHEPTPDALAALQSVGNSLARLIDDNAPALPTILRDHLAAIDAALATLGHPRGD